MTRDYKGVARHAPPRLGCGSWKLNWAYLDIPEPAPRAHLFRPGEVSAVCGRTAPRAVLPTLDQDPEHPHNCPWCMCVWRTAEAPQKITLH